MRKRLSIIFPTSVTIACLPIRVATSAATPILCRKKRGYAASGTSMDKPPLHKRHLFFAAKTRLRPGAMSMDMALLSCAPGAMSTDFVFVTWIYSRCEEATTRFDAQDG